jgi:hypothetical protein
VAAPVALGRRVADRARRRRRRGFALGTWAFVPAAVAFVCVAVFAATECGIAGAAASAALFTTSEDPS